ncbi:phage protein NinX family protein [Pseudomonas typographi]|uniref:DUF2591 family protein n=1 Tax=Pseudomonas typographi TaxID=2715964 RepID=A0ABR7Z9H0_9PSED|nr:phage protein NinX family protein [Pseudomonas typographi]MBD1601959.1 DUF2591 family protein [Pseudomonas typographi]
MSDFVEVKTQDLEGAALDWATGISAGHQMKLFSRAESGVFIPDAKGFVKELWKPSADWSQGGPLIEKYGVSLDCIAPLNSWEAFVWGGPSACNGFIAEAETPLIAACRAIVASVMGDTVSVPRELLP